MADTKKIKVKRVEAADPELTVTLESTDAGTFPAYVRVDAHITDAADGGDYHGTGQASGGGLLVVVVVQFADANYPTEVTLHYDLTVYFSPDGRNWTQVPSGDVSGATGDVTATHAAVADAEIMAEAEPAKPSGAANKGCLGVLFGVLPF